MQVSKSKLKAKLLEYLRLVKSQDQEIIIIYYGKNVLKISKYFTSPTTDELFSSMRGKVQYFEDLTAPTTDEFSVI